MVQRKGSTIDQRLLNLQFNDSMYTFFIDSLFPIPASCNAYSCEKDFTFQAGKSFNVSELQAFSLDSCFNMVSSETGSLVI